MGQISGPSEFGWALKQLEFVEKRDFPNVIVSSEIGCSDLLYMVSLRKILVY